MSRTTTIALLLAAPFVALTDSTAQDDFLDELPMSRRLNGSITVKAFGEAGEAARASTLVILKDGKACALATAIDAEGHVVTKSSELEGAEKLTAVDHEGGEHDAELLASDPATDLALVKVEGSKAVPVRWGDPDSLMQGTWIAGMTHEAESLSIGVISATRRAIKRRPGVIGVNLDTNDDPDELGVTIDGFGPNSPAEKEGLLVGDLLIRIEDKEIKSRKDLAETVRKFDPLDDVRVKVLRGEEGIPFVVTLNYMSNVFDMLDRNQRMSGQTSKRKAGFSDVLQHDLPLDPKAMGGPLVDLAGETVGVNIARADRVTTFALPAKVVIDVIADLKKKLADRQR